MIQNTKGWLVAGCLALATFTACKKDQEEAPAAPAPTTPTTPTVSLADRVKDTSFAISQELYLWYSQLPKDFKPRSYAGPQEIMTAIRQYSIEPGFTKPVDRWSFAVKQSEWDNVSSGIAGDLGLNVFFLEEGDLRVRAVEPESPAGKAGVRRGWRIRSINGNTAITTANSSTIVTAVYRSSSTQFGFEKPDGTTVNVTLNAVQYQEKPVLLDTLYATGGKKIGYMVFNSFLGDTTDIYNRFQQTFTKFSTAGVNDVVIDLRYNGGGYVTVQNKLAGYLAPTSANNDVLMKTQYNDKLSNYNRSTKMQKLGNLNLPRVFFIVSSNTASASELIINNLKPYMEVKLVGPSNTYGKPVGYSSIPVGDWYVFPVLFRSTNKLDQGNYFDGIAVDRKVADGIDKDFGDLQENCLASVVKYITTGSYGPRIEGRAKLSATEDPRVMEANNTFSSRQFKGMIQPGNVSLR